MHAWQPREHVLDLGRIDVDAARDDEVVPPAVEEQVALLEVTEVAGREGVVPPRAPRALGIAPVLEAGEPRHMAPDEAVVIDLQPAPGPRPSHGARMLQPLVGRAHGELSLGGAV